MRVFSMKMAALCIVALFFAGCATSPASRELFVGVSPDYPPVIFKQNEGVAGIEADLARKLGETLNRPVRFVVLNWQDEVPALLDGTIDMIMSGMSVTKAREVRIVFAEPYLNSGLIAAFRAEDAGKYATKDSILNGFVAIGAVKGTTGEAFVQRSFPNAVRRTFFPKVKDGVYELKRRSIDIFVNDAPSIVWTVSENEADIAALWEPLTEEYLAWGLRKGDEKLLTDVDSILRQWKQDGTLHQVLRRWLPEAYLKRMNQ